MGLFGSGGIDLMENEEIEIKVACNCLGMPDTAVFGSFPGKLFITNKRVCFYGRGLGETKFELSYDQIKGVEKAYFPVKCPIPGLAMKITVESGEYKITTMKRSKILVAIEAKI